MSGATKDQFAKDINFNKVLFLHMNRVAMSDSQTAMDANVDIMESLLCPYFDEDYVNEITTAKKALKNSLMTNVSSGQSEFTKERFRALMRLAERKNLLLTKEADAIDDDPDAYDEGYEDPSEAV